MDKNRTIIIALIVIALIALAGIIAFGTQPKETKAVAYEIPLKAQDLKVIEIKTPEGSDFQIKNNQSGAGKGMIFWKNNGNFSNETEGIAVSKNYTTELIPENAKLIMDNETEKVYETGNVNKNYQFVKTINDTDIIITGHNLNLIKKMANSTVVKDTSNITKEPAKLENKTPVQKVVEKSKEKKQVEKKAKQKAKPKKVVETTTEPEPAPKKNTYPIYIGGGEFDTGSELEDKTYAKIYLGVEHSGEPIGIKILYSRDGKALNEGNYVETTVEDDGYVRISSADSYSLYPDYAVVKVYDGDGNLQNTQEITLEPKSGAQYF